MPHYIFYYSKVKKYRNAENILDIRKGKIYVKSMYNLQLETFIVVADMGSFNKAAEALYITPPAVTKQINLLEKDLGLKLFNRTHRGLALTEAGKSLYRDAKYIIQYCKESVERARKAMEEKDNIIRIGTWPLLSCSYGQRFRKNARTLSCR